MLLQTWFPSGYMSRVALGASRAMRSASSLPSRRSASPARPPRRPCSCIRTATPSATTSATSTAPPRPTGSTTNSVEAAAARSSTLRAGHACADPGFQRLHEVLVRERWSRAAGARVPSPQDERIHLHVLDDLLPRAAAPVPNRVLHLLADL